MSKVKKKKRTATLLNRMRVDGTAVVDHPAHEHPGWAVIKAALGSLETDEEVAMEKEVEERLEAIFAKAEEFSQQHTGLMQSLVDSQEYLDEAPEHIKAAAVLLYHYLDTIATTEEATGDAEADAEADIEPEVQHEEAVVATAKAKSSGLLARMFGLASKTLENEDTTEEETKKAKTEESVKVEDPTLAWKEFLDSMKSDISEKIRREEA